MNVSNAMEVAEKVKQLINNSTTGGLSDVELSSTADIIVKLVSVRGKLDEVLRVTAKY